MGEIVVGILGPVMQLGQWVWTPVKRGMSYMVHYKKKLQSLDLQFSDLEVKWNDHNESVASARTGGHQIKREVEAWLTKAENAMGDARELKDEAEAGEKCFIGWCPDLKWRYNLGKRAWNLTTTLKNLVEEAEFETVSLEVRQPLEVQRLISTEGFEPFEATRQGMYEVMNALEKDEITAIGVYGMGGIGKTTVVKQVARQVCNGLFNRMIMAVVSQNPVVMQIQDQLKDMLALNLHETTEMTRAARLKKTIIEAGKKILIILDDIWDTKVLSDVGLVGIPSHDELRRCGSKVILTTRRSQICHAMGCQVVIRLNILSEDDSWKLFVKTARNESLESTDFCEVAKQVANECGGLPVALIAVARALGDKYQLKEWQEAARRLKNSQPASDDDDGRVLECMRLSYDFLNSEDAKSCFLLCCLFPEDYDIPENDLIKYGLGKGLFRADTFEDARSRAHSVINYLKASNLLLDGERDEFVRMHDVIRDMAMLIASSEYDGGFLVKARTEMTVWPSNADERHSAISLMKNYIGKLPEELVCPKLQILLLQDNEYIKEIPETFFESLNELKVLDLSRTGISIVPESLSLRTNLQALYLDDCQSIRYVSLLGKLKKLEILSLRGSALEELPEGIGNLARLKMLDLSGCRRIKRIPSNLMSS
ncbi:putative P-loop containing nucleoside triphosphate hydrolase, leucine-rich repeat domain, L [Rosa chinensis]|uniref:Putative P-loop containing nucleoside triphosphate hydrolase, leucine-rich repeat domain, L n=1 Tax=Rosa chinensis TaxID=74649 RepID=A0A2P6PM93_ROSCH|nr:putative P-loop containing nucleoside triphosphate hydrolase, leucine-rich repeat domain, L [Rosa chinensis]